jgi:hypothetical protein
LLQWYNTVFSLWRQKWQKNQSPQHARRCKRCGTCEFHLLLSRLYWFDYSCWVSLVMIGKHKWLCHFVNEIVARLDDISSMATHHRRSIYSWEACLQRNISLAFNNQSGEGHAGFSELALCDDVQRRPLLAWREGRIVECQRILPGRIIEFKVVETTIFINNL